MIALACVRFAGRAARRAAVLLARLETRLMGAERLGV